MYLICLLLNPVYPIHYNVVLCVLIVIQCIYNLQLNCVNLLFFHAGRQNTFNKHKQDICFDSWNYWGGRLGLWCLMSLSTVFQLYIVINDKTNCFLENAEIRKKELFFSNTRVQFFYFLFTKNTYISTSWQSIFVYYWNRWHMFTFCIAWLTDWLVFSINLSSISATYLYVYRGMNKFHKLISSNKFVYKTIEL